MGQSNEKPLTGGHITPVARRGDRVLRESGPWTPTVQRLLAHLREQGLTWVPEPHGWAADGREEVGYLKGKVPTYPLPAWVYDDAILVKAAKWLRKAHDATVDYVDPDARWRAPGRRPAEVICHNDFAPYNMVFKDHKLVGVIDWDFASPGPRLWDVAYLAYRLVPLMSAENPDAPDFPVDLRHRLQLLLDSYGSKATPFEVLAVVVERLDELAEFTHSHALARRDDELHEHSVAYSADAHYLRSLLA